MMSARKSMLGKRKNIPRPIRIQPPISTINDRLGTGKEQRQGFVIIFVIYVMNIKNNMLFQTKCFDIVYFKNNVDKSAVYVADKPEDFVPLFHD
jgi:hypothetical protein